MMVPRFRNSKPISYLFFCVHFFGIDEKSKLTIVTSIMGNIYTYNGSCIFAILFQRIIRRILCYTLLRGNKCKHHLK